ncbi:MAG: chromate efflux transporter [Planctomycetota bacterium]|nr:MAG: chromate efflux transporter [Planctomycetota bacterium]
MTDPVSQPPTLAEATGTWTRVAALSFGGPAGQIAVMHRILVEEKKWISEERFLHALNFCMLLPGPEAQQLATYIGWLMHGVRGGLIAGTLFIIPGAISILVLSWIYAANQQSSAIQALFYGLKPAVLAIVFEAVLRIGKRVLKNRLMNGIAGLSFIAIFFFAVPFPIIVIAAGLIGYCGGRIAPKQFLILKGHGGTTGTEDIHDLHMAPVVPSWGRTLRVSFLCLSLWFGPLIALYYWLGPDSIYLRQGLFFSQAAVVTFGGAYSVLAYVAQQAVERFHWLKPTEMLNGLGMAETTPGPLIMVVQYVAFMGAYRDPGPLSPLMAGVLGSAITTWVTFVPCFYWIFLGAPYIERLRGQKLLTAALSTITAAVVGVVLNLAVWFAIHTVFADVSSVTCGWLHLECPRWGSLDLAASGIAVLALILTFRMKVTMPITLLISAAVGAIGYLWKRQIWISE